MKKRTIALILSVLMLVSVLASCGGNTDPGTTDEPGTSGTPSTPETPSNPEAIDKDNIDNSSIYPSVSIACGDPGNLVPWITNKDGCIILYSVYEPLFDTLSMGGELYPVLADEDRGEFHGYDHEAGSNVYRVYICDDIYDSAGNHMTADDIKFTVDVFKEKGATGRWTQFDHIEVIDETTCDWYFTEELNLVGGLDIYFCSLFFTQAGYEASPDDFAVTACGTGRYELSKFTAGVGATLERREDYWQKDESKIRQAHQANVQTVNYSFITEASQQVINLQTGNIDLVENVAYDTLEPFATGEYSETYDVYSKRDNLNFMFNANCASPLCSDINFRLACFYAVDADAICTVLGSGAATRSYAMGNTNFGDYEPEWDNAQWGDYDYEHVTDLDLAKEYLDKSSYDGQTVEIITKNDSNGTGQIVEIIGSMLEQIGVKWHMTQYEPATYDSVAGDPKGWDFNLDTWAGGSYVIASMFSYFNPSAAFNTHYEAADPELHLSQMIDNTRIIANHTKENLEAIQTEIFGNAYSMALLSKNRNTVYNSGKFTYLEMNYKGWVLPGGCSYVNG